MRPIFLTLSALLLAATAAPIRAEDRSRSGSAGRSRHLAGKNGADRPTSYGGHHRRHHHPGHKWLAGTERVYSDLIAARVRWSLMRRSDLFVNSGIFGERSAGLLADIDWRVLHFQPDVV
jgi:hypothetical protein